MTIREYNVNVGVLIKPVWHTEPPTILIGVNGNSSVISVSEDTWFNYNYKTSDSNGKLHIEFFGKSDSDTIVETNQDKAIIIEQIKLNGIHRPSFVWQGEYRPNYPIHLKNEPEVLRAHTYLGWNGIWTLDFTIPVFTWIHKIENLGWIYD